MSGSLYIVSAPSGAGKTSLVNKLIQLDSHIVVSVSSTTRPIRPGEEDGVNYHFLSTEAFEQKIADQDFLEYAKVFDNFYGTSRTTVEEQLKKGKDVILEIDWQGAQQVRKLRPDAISIFILPPSVEALEQRLCGRKQDSQEIIKTRLKQSCDDMCHYDEFDYIVINDNFDNAVEDLASIFKCNRMKLDCQKQRHQAFLEDITKNS